MRAGIWRRGNSLPYAGDLSTKSTRRALFSMHTIIICLPVHGKPPPVTGSVSWDSREGGRIFALSFTQPFWLCPSATCSQIPPDSKCGDPDVGIFCNNTITTCWAVIRPHLPTGVRISWGSNRNEFVILA